MPRSFAASRSWQVAAGIFLDCPTSDMRSPGGKLSVGMGWWKKEPEANRVFVDDGATPEQWEAIRRAAESGNQAETGKVATAASFNQQMGQLFFDVIQCDRERERVERAGDGGFEESRDCKDKIELYGRVTPRSTGEADELAAKIEELRKRATAAYSRADVGRVAAIERNGLRQRFPGLFGVEYPRPPGDPIPHSVTQRLSELGLSLWKVNPHLDYAPAVESRKRESKTVQAADAMGAAANGL